MIGWYPWIKKRANYLSCIEEKRGLIDNHCSAQNTAQILIYYKISFSLTYQTKNCTKKELSLFFFARFFRIFLGTLVLNFYSTIVKVYLKIWWIYCITLKKFFFGPKIPPCIQVQKSLVGGILKLCVFLKPPERYFFVFSRYYSKKTQFFDSYLNIFSWF